MTCSDLMDYFGKAQMLTGALKASAYLKEAAVQRKLTRDQIAAVRKYLSDLQRKPALAFVPPLDPPGRT